MLHGAPNVSAKKDQSTYTTEVKDTESKVNSLPDLPAIKLSEISNRIGLNREKEKLEGNLFTKPTESCEYKKQEWVLKKCLLQGDTDNEKEFQNASQEVVGGLVARFFDSNQPDIRLVRDDNTKEYFVISKKIKDFKSFNQFFKAKEKESKENPDGRMDKKKLATYASNLQPHTIPEWIKKGRLKNLGKLVIIDFLVAENDGGTHNIGFIPVLDEQGKPLTENGCPIYYLVQIDRDQSSNPKRHFVLKDTNGNITKIYCFQVSPQDINDAPCIKGVKRKGEAAGFQPYYWFNHILKHEISDPDYPILDGVISNGDPISQNELFRNELNEILFELVLWTDDVIKAMISKVLGDQPFKDRFVEFFKQQRDGIIHAALQTEPRVGSFRKFLEGDLSGNVLRYKQKLQSFKIGDEVLFPDAKKHLEEVDVALKKFLKKNEVGVSPLARLISTAAANDSPIHSSAKSLSKEAKAEEDSTLQITLTF